MQRKHRFRSFWRLLIPLLLIAIYLGGGCSDLRTTLGGWVDKTFGKATARQAYRWTDPYPPGVLQEWDSAHTLALNDTLSVSLPHRERVTGDSTLLQSAQSLNFHLPVGRVVRISAESDSPGLFGELYSISGGDRTRIASWDTMLTPIVYEARQEAGESLQLVVQTVPYATFSYGVRIISQPALLFPVAGKDAGAIRSFWGASRDGGRRRHEGNDIFADRGTPLLAVTDGRISRVRDGGLGGKTVWLNDGKRGLTYYYAHLDSQLVKAGEYVERGDTVGTVGNTGNARTTPPHLHFGIYRRGARDPLPYLLGADPLPVAATETIGAYPSVPERGNHYLRTSPERVDNVIRKLRAGEALSSIGVTGRYHRVRTAAGELGYVNFD